MKFHKGIIKSFSLGCLCGSLMTILLIFGIATISVLKNGKRLVPGYMGDLSVNINNQPWEGYDWSLDISQQEKCLVRLGKRKEASVADRCQLIDPQGNILVYMVWDDMEAAPGFALFNDKMTIASLAFGENGSEHRFTYGPYGLPAEKIHSDDIGYKDLDFDGQFDLKEIFNDDGTIQKVFILVNSNWEEATQLDRAISMALIQQGEEERTYLFQQRHGWCLQ